MLVEKIHCHHTVDAYYDNEMDNYYCITCSKGMGVLYYRLAKKYEALVKQYEPFIRQSVRGEKHGEEETGKH